MSSSSLDDLVADSTQLKRMLWVALYRLISYFKYLYVGAGPPDSSLVLSLGRRRLGPEMLN